MTRFGLSAQGMVLLGTSSSQDDKSLAGFEELAMPPISGDGYFES